MCFSKHTFKVCISHFKSVLGPLCLTRHIWLRPCSSRSGGTAQGEVNCPWRAPCQLKKTFKNLKPSQGSCWKGERRIIPCTNRGKMVCPAGKSIFFFVYKKQTERKWVGGRTWFHSSDSRLLWRQSWPRRGRRFSTTLQRCRLTPNQTHLIIIGFKQ